MNESVQCYYMLYLVSPQLLNIKHCMFPTPYLGPLAFALVSFQSIWDLQLQCQI